MPFPQGPGGEMRQLGEAFPGLDDIIEGAGLHRLDRHFLIAMAGHDHRRKGETIVLVFLQQLDAAAVREEQIDDGQVRGGFGQPAPGLTQGAGDGQANSRPPFEGAQDQLDVSLLVLHQQDIQGILIHDIHYQ